ncbi:hypothetical protein [Streptomyces sp. NPDC001770]
MARDGPHLDRIEDTRLLRQVSRRIELFREEIVQRAPRSVPY